MLEPEESCCCCCCGVAGAEAGCAGPAETGAGVSPPVDAREFTVDLGMIMETAERLTDGNLLMSGFDGVDLTTGRGSGSSGEVPFGTTTDLCDGWLDNGLGKALSCSEAIMESITAVGAGACGATPTVRTPGVYVAIMPPLSIRGSVRVD